MLAIQLFGYLVAILALGTAVRGELDLLQLGRSSKDPLVGGHKVKQTRVDPLQLVSVEEVLGELQQLKISHGRDKRQSEPSGVPPATQGNHEFDDIYRYARIHYSGAESNAIFVLTFDIGNNGLPLHTNLYRSVDYGSTFTPIETNLDPNNADPLLWPEFYVSDFNKNMLVFPHATEAKFYYTLDEGDTWTVQTFSPTTINPRSLLWNPKEDKWIIAHDGTNDHLYVTQDLGQTWTKIADYVDNPSDYQWGDPDVDTDHSIVYFNTYDPQEQARGNDTVDLYTQRHPYTDTDREEFDPKLGKHDGFVLVGPYIFAQKTSDAGDISLLVSYNRKPFNLAKIPSFLSHERYLVSHINSLQALVIVEHTTTQHNLYLSDTTGEFYVLSLTDIVIEGGTTDLEVIEGINGTIIANQYVRDDPSETNAPVRTLLTLDNGGEWELLRPPSRDVNGEPVVCEPPLCSLHFHMGTSEYARLGVYSEASSPGIIVAHGSVGEQLSADPDLYISRDGGISWEETLADTWGVTMADHGGLIVAAKDYHQAPSSEIMYSCNEGVSWQSFIFGESDMYVFGVITEPGEHTTIVSLYGIESTASPYTWVVVTINFTSIFPRVCGGEEDYYDWEPWDERTDGEDCILGSSIVIERRKIDVCCLNGRDYVREFDFSICSCAEEDFECDYGYMRSDGLSGPCVRDPTIILPSHCGDSSETTYQQTRGYRKIAGDVCVGGDEAAFAPYTAFCCGSTTQPTVDCGPLSAPPHGQITSTSTTLGSVATFTCDSGYIPYGVNVRACQADGTWSGTQPTCVNCGSLADPANGVVSVTSTTCASVATYRCNSGYELRGVGVRFCQATGSWSGTAPTCTAIQCNETAPTCRKEECGPLPDPANGIVSVTSTTCASVATYRCNSGYELSGVGVRFCQATGSWSGTTPTCTSGTAPTCPAIQCNGTAPACRKEELEEEEDKLVAGDIVFSVILLLLIAAVVALSVTVCICAWKRHKLRRRYLNAITEPQEQQFSYRNVSNFEPTTDSEPLTALTPEDYRDGGADDDDEPIVP